MSTDGDLFPIVLIITISLLLLVEAYYIFGRPRRPKPVPTPKGCQQCSPGTGEGNPSGCKLPDNYSKCKSWEQEHPNGCCVYDANKGFTCYESGSQCEGWKCDNAYDNAGFACTDGGKQVPVPANPWNNCKMC